MYGGLKKTASRLALVAAAGVLSTNAFAADLGGDCCADLEERVAELEATTARKGTRKTSLEIWGDVNKVILYWNDGFNSNVNLGADNVNYSTRFGLRGMAKIMPGTTAGYSIVIEMASGGRSTNISQFNDKKAISGVANTATYAGQFGDNDAGITMRESNWWIENVAVGRLTVGRFVTGIAGPQGQIDLANIGSTVAGGSLSLLGSGLVFRSNNAPAATAAAGTGNYTNYSIANTTDSAGEYGTRGNGIMWTSPTWAGFSLGASVSGALQKDSQCSVNPAGTCVDNFQYGPQWSAVAKYANEFNGLRVAAAIGYEKSLGENSTSMNAVNPTALNSYRPDSSDFSASLSLLHVPTGLFVQSFYNTYTRGHDLFNSATGAASVYSTAGVTSDTARQFLVQLGITKNWFGIGNTTVYGEYAKTTNAFNTFGIEGAGGAAFTNGALTAGGAGTVAYFGDNTTNTMWGIGIAQNIDAAAMQLYAGYRDFALTSGNCTALGGCKDIGMFVAGGQIKF